MTSGGTLVSLLLAAPPPCYVHGGPGGHTHLPLKFRGPTAESDLLEKGVGCQSRTPVYLLWVRGLQKKNAGKTLRGHEAALVCV